MPWQSFKHCWTFRRHLSSAWTGNSIRRRRMRRKCAASSCSLARRGAWNVIKPQYCSLKYLDVFCVVYRIGGQNVARTKREVAHLALDATRILAPAARHDPFFQNLVEHSLMKRFSLLRGE